MSEPEHDGPAQPAPLAILGGTFDPVHYGHLRAADEVRKALDVPAVRLVPAAEPPHREAPRTAARDRVAMLDLAVGEFPGLVIDTREIVRGGKSYTVDTLRELRAEHPGTPLLLVVGADAFHGLSTWHEWRSLFDLAHVVVVPRPGIDVAAGLPEALAREWRARHTEDARALRTARAGSIYIQPVSAQPISSTAIRRVIAEGDARSVEIAGLLPSSVLAYIESHRLYRPPTHAS